MLLHLWNSENLPYYCTFLTQFLFNGGQQWVDSIAKSKGHNFSSSYRYAIVIDAGSTGSRVHAFKFRIPFTGIGPTMLDLDQNYYAKSTPGLSDFVHDPAKGAQTIVDLIHKADFLTPLNERHRTPIVVRPTAGLRLLSKTDAKNIIDHVADAISRLGYYTDKESVKIMDGADEGLFNWIAINLFARYSYARNNIKPKEMLAALDMGGSSLQMAYNVNEELVSNYPSKDIYDVGTKEPIKVYAHSYLKLGINAARDGILRLESPMNMKKTFTTVCLDPAVRNLSWTFMGQKYSVSGAYREPNLSRKVIYKRCQRWVKKYLLMNMDWKPVSPPRNRVAAVSNFLRTAQDAGIVGADGGIVPVYKYRRTAIRVCSDTNPNNPWLCLNLIYVVTVLKDGFKMNITSTLHLYNRVEGVQVTWTTGLAYMTVLNRLTHRAMRSSECISYDIQKKVRFSSIVCAYRAFRQTSPFQNKLTYRHGKSNTCDK